MKVVVRIGVGLVLVSSALLLPVIRPALGQEPRTFVDQVVVEEDGESVTAFVSVLDSAGRPVPDLSAFSVDVDGAPVHLQSVASAVSEEAGVAVLLLMDVSGSMAGEPLAQSRQAAVGFVEGLLPADEAAVLPFASTVSGNATFTADRELLSSEIEGLEVEGETGTALHDAVIEGLDATTGAASARRAIILLTDGRESGARSQHSLDDALERAASAGLPIFTIGLGESADLAFLQALASESGGRSYAAPGPGDVAAIFDAVGETLRGQYVLRVALPASERTERQLTVTVTVDGEQRLAQATFRTLGAPGASDGGAAVPVWVWGAAGVAVLVASGAAGTTLLRRRRRPRSALPGGPGQDISLANAPAEAPPAESLRGSLTVIAGPNQGKHVSLAGGPIDIGTDPTCSLRLDGAGDAVAERHARAWLQHKRLMLHHLARGRQTLVAGKPVEWATLERGETIQIGPHIISFASED